MVKKIFKALAVSLSSFVFLTSAVAQTGTKNKVTNPNVKVTQGTTTTGISVKKEGNKTVTTVSGFTPVEVVDHGKPCFNLNHRKYYCNGMPVLKKAEHDAFKKKIESGRKDKVATVNGPVPMLVIEHGKPKKVGGKFQFAPAVYATGKVDKHTDEELAPIPTEPLKEEPTPIVPKPEVTTPLVPIPELKGCSRYKWQLDQPLEKLCSEAINSRFKFDAVPCICKDQPGFRMSSLPVRGDDIRSNDKEFTLHRYQADKCMEVVYTKGNDHFDACYKVPYKLK